MSLDIQLVINEEDFLTSRHVKKILKEWVDPAIKDFNFEHCSLREHALAKILTSLKTPPMMADTRTVVVDDLEILKKEDEEQLVRYFENPNPGTRLLLLTRKIDKRTALYKILIRVAKVYEFKRPYPNRVPEFIVQEANNLSLTLENGVAPLLAELVGGDLMSLVSELEKLKLFIHPQTRIRREHVTQLVGTGLVDQVWALGEKVARRDLNGSLELVRRMLEQGEAPIAIVALLVSQFRKVFLAQNHALRRLPQPLESLLGVPTFVTGEYMTQAKSFSALQLKKIFQRLMRLSEDLRRSGVSSPTLLNDFVQGVFATKY